MESATFDKLLALLHPDREQAAIEYRRLHERLTRYFDWNGGEDPPALADKTIDRIERRIDRSDLDGPIQSVAAFSLGVARHVLLEDARNRKKATDVGAQWKTSGQTIGTDEKEKMDRALSYCLKQLPAGRRKLIEAYYVYGDDKSRSRQKLAMQYGITVNALRTRALRVRQELEAAIREYLANKSQ